MQPVQWWYMPWLAYCCSVSQSAPDSVLIFLEEHAPRLPLDGCELFPQLCNHAITYHASASYNTKYLAMPPTAILMSQPGAVDYEPTRLHISGQHVPLLGSPYWCSVNVPNDFTVFVWRACTSVYTLTHSSTSIAPPILSALPTLSSVTCTCTLVYPLLMQVCMC